MWIQLKTAEPFAFPGLWDAVGLLGGWTHQDHIRRGACC